MVGRQWQIFTLAAILATTLRPGPATGQAGRIWLEPRVGWVVPTRDLGRTDIIDNAGFGVFERVDRSASVGLGASIELGRRWALRGSVDRSFKAGVQGEWRCVPFVACPAVLLPVDGELVRWTVAFDGVYRPATPLPVDPVVFVGMGVRRTLLDWSEPAAGVTLPGFSFDDTDAMVRFGLGIERSAGPARLFGEVEVTSARFGGAPYESIEGGVEADRTRSVDVGLVGGVRIRLW